MYNKEKVKTQDGGEAAAGELIWFVRGDTPISCNLIIGYHDKLFKIFKSKAALLERYNIQLKLVEVTCVLKESSRSIDKQYYLCTFDGQVRQIDHKVFKFFLTSKESFAEIGEHLDMDEIQEITIKYLES